MEKRKVEFENCTLYCGDCYEIIKEIGDKSIDLIHTDPPYQIISQSNTDKNNCIRRNFWNKINTCGIADGFDYSLLEEFKRITKTVNYQLWCSKSQFLDFLIYAKENDYNWQDIMLYRNNPVPVCYSKYLDKDYCVHMWEGRRITGEYRDKKTDYHWNITPNKAHPTQKPIYPTECLIRTGSSQGDIVFDPFMGSGTTGIAALMNKRKFIGIEKNPEFFDIAVKRIREVLANSTTQLF